MNTRALAELIQLAVKKAVREELKSFKTQIINEIRSSNQGDFDSSDYYERPQPSKQKRKFTSDSTLNEILNQTRPLSSDERRGLNSIENFKTKKGEIINVPTDDAGNPMRSVPSHVLEAMNRNYGDMFAEEAPKPKPQAHRQPVQQQQTVNPDIRAQVLQYMPPLGENNYEFEEDEDMSWMNEVA